MVCLVAIASAFHMLVLDRLVVPDNALRVSDVATQGGGRDWIIRIYDSVGPETERRRWQAADKTYRIDIQQRGKHGFLLDITYRPESGASHRVRQQVRLAAGPTLVAAFGQAHSGGQIRVIVDRVK